MAEAHTKHHDYHLVDPSPWPAVGSVSAFITAVGGISWMHHMFAGAPFLFGLGAIGILYTFIVWWRDVVKEAQVRRLPHARRADFTSLRNDPFHRLRGDVLRCLVLGLLQHRAVSGRRHRRGAHRVHRRRVAAEGHRDVRPVAPAAVEYAHPFDLRHDGNLGAPCPARRRPPGLEVGPDPHHRARRHLHLRAGLRVLHTRISISAATSTARRSSWRPASTART